MNLFCTTFNWNSVDLSEDLIPSSSNLGCFYHNLCTNIECFLFKTDLVAVSNQFHLVLAVKSFSIYYDVQSILSSSPYR